MSIYFIYISANFDIKCKGILCVPAIPGSPFGPVKPSVPLNPVAPGAPDVPFRPAAPGTPGRPLKPGRPCKPGGPLSPKEKMIIIYVSARFYFETSVDFKEFVYDL